MSTVDTNLKAEYERFRTVALKMQKEIGKVMRMPQGCSSRRRKGKAIGSR